MASSPTRHKSSFNSGLPRAQLPFQLDIYSMFLVENSIIVLFLGTVFLFAWNQEETLTAVQHQQLSSLSVSLSASLCVWACVCMCVCNTVQTDHVRVINDFC